MWCGYGRTPPSCLRPVPGPAPPSSAGLFLPATPVPQRRRHSSPASTRNLVVGDTLRGIKRTLGTAQHKKEALLEKDIRRLVAACPKNLSGTRDKALFLISFAGAFRRSESSGLNVEELKFCREGVVCTLRRSKTDQEGARPRGRHSIRQRQNNLPYPRTQYVAQTSKDQLWPSLPSCRSCFTFRPLLYLGTDLRSNKWEFNFGRK